MFKFDTVYKQLASLFTITHIIGLFVAFTIINSKLIEAEQSVESGGYLFLYILFVTAIFLGLVVFFKKDILFRIIEALAIFSTTSFLVSIILLYITPDAVINAVLPNFFGLFLVAIKNIYKEDITIKNVAAVIAGATAGGIIGAMLGILPVLLFVTLLALYDIVAVFYTKHMVKMAKAIVSKNLAFTYALPTKEHTFQLGTGDFVIPMVIASAVMATQMPLGYPYFLLGPIIIMFASLTGLIGTIKLVRNKPGNALPALPMQVLLMLIVVILLKVLGLL